MSEEKSDCICQRAIGKVSESSQYLKNAVKNAVDHTAEMSADDIEKHRLHSVAAYFGILFLIPLFAAKDSRFARFHTNQGILLTIAGVLAGVAVSIIGAILLPIPFLGIFLYVIISVAISVAFLGLMIFGIYNVLNGYAKELPLIGGYRVLADKVSSEKVGETASLTESPNADTTDLHSSSNDAH